MPSPLLGSTMSITYIAITYHPHKGVYSSEQDWVGFSAWPPDVSNIWGLEAGVCHVWNLNGGWFGIGRILYSEVQGVTSNDQIVSSDFL